MLFLDACETVGNTVKSVLVTRVWSFDLATHLKRFRKRNVVSSVHAPAKQARPHACGRRGRSRYLTLLALQRQPTFAVLVGKCGANNDQGAFAYRSYPINNKYWKHSLYFLQEVVRFENVFYHRFQKDKGMQNYYTLSSSGSLSVRCLLQ